MPHRGRAWLVVTVMALSFVLSVFEGDLTPRSAQAQIAPQVEISPSSAAPGATVTMVGSGWPPGVTLRARMYRESDLNGPGADLRMTFDADATGAFTADGVIPPTLFGAGGPGNVEVTPGPYTIVVRAGPGLSASTSFLVIPATSCDGERHPS